MRRRLIVRHQRTGPGTTAWKAGQTEGPQAPQSVPRRKWSWTTSS